MTLNKKCLGWIQSVSKGLVIKVLRHKINYMAKKRKQELLCINTREDDDGHVAVETSNLVAAEHNIMCETFVNEAMSWNVTMTGKPPMSLAVCLANIVFAKKRDQDGGAAQKRMWK